MRHSFFTCALVLCAVGHSYAQVRQQTMTQLAERQKMARLKKLRLEKEAAEKLAVNSRAVMETESAVLPRERPEKYVRDNLKATPSRLDRGTSGSTRSTLAEWLTQQERDGGRY